MLRLSSIASRNFHHFRILAVMSRVEDMDYTPSGSEAAGKEPTATPDGDDATEPPQSKDMKRPLDSSGNTPDVEGTSSGEKEPTATPDGDDATEPLQGKDMKRLDSGGDTPDMEDTPSGEKGPTATPDGDDATESPNNDLKPKRPLESGDTSGSMAKFNSKKDAGSDEDHKSKKPKNPEGPSWYQQPFKAIPSFFMKRFYSQPSYSKEYWQNLSLEEKRKSYSCRDKFLQLKHIQKWPEYASENKIPRFKGEVDIPINSTLNDKVSLWKGDITRLEIDAIVNAANSSLMGGGGVDGAIHSAASTSLMEECADLGGCDVGDAKLSTGHRLPAKYIIHTVGPMDEDDSSLKSCYQNCLRIVTEKNFKSVAFCCIATGVYGFPNRRAAEIALSTAREWLDTEDNADKIDRIIFTTFLKKDTMIYEELLQFYFPLEKSGAGSDPENRRDVSESKASEEPPIHVPPLQKHATAPAVTHTNESDPAITPDPTRAQDQVKNKEEPKTPKGQESEPQTGQDPVLQGPAQDNVDISNEDTTNNTSKSSDIGNVSNEGDEMETN